MDLFLLISSIIIGLILIIVNIYILASFLHPDDRGFGETWFPKMVVVLGLTLSFGQILLVPLDVSNSRGFGGGLNMLVLWQTIVVIAFIFITMVLPFCLFYYQTDEHKAQRQRLIQAGIYTGIAFVLFAIVYYITWKNWGYSNLPVKVQSMDFHDVADYSNTYVDLNHLRPVTTTQATIRYNVGFVVYTISFFSFIGWWFFALFAGMGLFAIPLDYIHNYNSRPRKRSPKEILQKKAEMQSKVAELINMGQDIENAENELKEAKGLLGKQKAQTKVNKATNRLKGAVLSVEKEFNIFQAEVNYGSIDPFTYKIDLFIGIILFIISLLWWVHVLVNCVLKDSIGLPKNTFLNVFLLWVSETLGASFIAAFMIVAFVGYLLIAIVKGNVKFGQKIPYLFTIHPMKPGETLMNSFVFNVGLIMISVFALLQFVSGSFSQYVRLTAMDMIFGVQVKYVDFYKSFFAKNVFETIFLVWSGLSMFCNCIFGKQRPFELKQIQSLRGLADKVTFGLMAE